MLSVNGMLKMGPSESFLSKSIFFMIRQALRRQAFSASTL
jgi:hypothetical protein